MPKGLAVAATPLRFEVAAMTRSAPSSILREFTQAFSSFSERGVALYIPDFGSVFRHEGADALDLLHRITTNSLIDLSDGAARQTVLTSDKGRIIDAPWVLKRSSNELLLVSDVSDPTALRDGVLRYTIIEDAELVDVSDEFVRMFVFGDNATAAIREAFPESELEIDDLGSFHEICVGSGGTAIAWRTDALGTATWMVLCQTAVVNEVSSRFSNTGLLPEPRSLFDHIRLINKIPIVGRELTDRVNPLEANLQHLIDFDKGCYVGQEVIARLDTYDKVQRRLVRFVQVTRDAGSEIIALDDRIPGPSGGRDIGWVSSVVANNATGRGYGLAYIRSAHAIDGSIYETSGGARIELQWGENEADAVSD